ncbi:hypothetical protein FCL38_24565 [Pseudoduganella umbonata]|nr:hypothetical protein FCL38_24565 [Pseudoduganella umbonata]
MTNPARHDPIRDRYFSIIEKAEGYGGLLFWLSTACSLGTAFIDATSYPRVADWVQIAFVVFVVFMFLLDVLSRFILNPRALDARLSDFWGKAYDRPLTTESTAGYYNNNEIDALKRAAAQTLESSLCTRAVLGKMINRFIPFAVLFITVLVIIVASRATTMSLVIMIVQLVLAEQIILRGVRLVWFKWRCDRIYQQLEQLFALQTPDESFRILAAVHITQYEATKAQAAITLSEKIFLKERQALCIEWEQIKTHLRIR